MTQVSILQEGNESVNLDYVYLEHEGCWYYLLLLVAYYCWIFLSRLQSLDTTNFITYYLLSIYFHYQTENISSH